MSNKQYSETVAGSFIIVLLAMTLGFGVFELGKWVAGKAGNEDLPEPDPTQVQLLSTQVDSLNRVIYNLRSQSFRVRLDNVACYSVLEHNGIEYTPVLGY